eukprot:1148926-Pelagomonas_calceolata.AAC.1
MGLHFLVPGASSHPPDLHNLKPFMFCGSVVKGTYGFFEPVRPDSSFIDVGRGAFIVFSACPFLTACKFLMLAEIVSPAADEPKSQAVGQPPLQLLTLELPTSLRGAQLKGDNAPVSKSVLLNLKAERPNLPAEG